jgi:hypothetical protein
MNSFRLSTDVMRQFRWFALVVLAISLIVMPAAAADDSQDAWAALANGGHVALIRHSNAPPGYGGDPPGFRLDDCATQGTWTTKGARRRARLVRRSASTACMWTGSRPHQ